MRPALAAHRSFSGSVLLLLKAAVWTLHTYLSRRRLCHGLALETSLCPCAKSCWPRFFVTDDFRPSMRRLRHTRVYAAGARACHLGFADKRGTLFDNKTRGFKITLQCAARLQFATFPYCDVALY